MKKIILILIFSIYCFGTSVISWQLNNLSIRNLINDKDNFKLTNKILNKNYDIMVLQGIKNLKLNKYVNLKNKKMIILNNYNIYNDNTNKFYAFIIDKKYKMATTFYYPNEDNIWKYPPIMLYIPKLNIGIINIQANPYKNKSLKETNFNLTYVLREINDLKNVVNYFKTKNVNLNNIILCGNFELEPEDIKSLLSNSIPLFNNKTTISNNNNGNFNNNIIVFTKDNISSYKILKKNIDNLFYKESFIDNISNNYPLQINLNY